MCTASNSEKEENTDNHNIKRLFHKNPSIPAVRRTQPTTKKAKISSTTHVQMLQWLHGKQQQQHWGRGYSNCTLYNP